MKINDMRQSCYYQIVPGSLIITENRNYFLVVKNSDNEFALVDIYNSQYFNSSVSPTVEELKNHLKISGIKIKDVIPPDRLELTIK